MKAKLKTAFEIRMMNSHKDRPMYTTDAVKRAKEVPAMDLYNPRDNRKIKGSCEMGKRKDRTNFIDENIKAKKSVPAPNDYAPKK
jgi:hypothetical protein